MEYMIPTQGVKGDVVGRMKLSRFYFYISKS